MCVCVCVCFLVQCFRTSKSDMVCLLQKQLDPPSHLKLMLVSTPLCVWADLCQSSDCGGQLPGQDLCAPTRERLKHCVMEECVLLLCGETERAQLETTLL